MDVGYVEVDGINPLKAKDAIDSLYSLMIVWLQW